MSKFITTKVFINPADEQPLVVHFNLIHVIGVTEEPNKIFLDDASSFKVADEAWDKLLHDISKESL